MQPDNTEEPKVGHNTMTPPPSSLSPQRKVGDPWVKLKDRQPDRDAPTCNTCSAKFTPFRRRHHCRPCGLVNCDDCCPKRKGPWKNPVRLCKSCWEAEKQYQQEGIQTEFQDASDQSFIAALQEKESSQSLVNSTLAVSRPQCGFCHETITQEAELDGKRTELVMYPCTAQQALVSLHTECVGRFMAAKRHSKPCAKCKKNLEVDDVVGLGADKQKYHQSCLGAFSIREAKTVASKEEQGERGE